MEIGLLVFDNKIIDEGMFIEFETFSESGCQFIDKKDALEIINHLNKIFEIK